MTHRTIPLSPSVRRLLDAASNIAGGEPAYLVGGSLRDALLEQPLTDLDLAVSGDALGFAGRLAQRLDGHFVPLDRQRRVARVVLDEAPVSVIDVVPLRGDIAADLAARDYTIDAIAAPLGAVAAGDAVELIDPTGGQRDLKRGLVRLVSEQALVEDPLRLLRAVRLAAQLDFKLTPDTRSAVRRHARRIEQSAAERQRDELVRCFATPRAAGALRLLDETDLMGRVFPEVTAGRGVSQPKEHYWDVFDHALETVAALDWMLAEAEPAQARQARFWTTLWDALGDFPAMRPYLAEEVTEGRTRAGLLKLAGLLHDVAKPETRAPDATGRIRFFGHAERGAETARAVLGRLRFSKRETQFVATAVEDHLRPGQLGQQGPPSRRALFRFYRDTGEAAEAVLLLSLADHLAARGPRVRIDGWRNHVAYIAHVIARRDEEETIVRPPRLLTGNDVMQALGIGPGPAVGRLLGAIEEAHAGGELTNRQEALGFVRELHGAPVRPRRPKKALSAAGGRP